MGDSSIPPSTYRNLYDKLYDRRKLGALEIEQLVKEYNNSKNEEGIKSIIKTLTTDFADSPQGNNKKGGLIGLAASSIGLGVVSIIINLVIFSFTQHRMPIITYFSWFPQFCVVLLIRIAGCATMRVSLYIILLKFQEARSCLSLMRSLTDCARCAFLNTVNCSHTKVIR
jgi:hypothetical protein